MKSTYKPNPVWVASIMEQCELFSENVNNRK